MARTAPLALALVCSLSSLAPAQAVGDGWWHTNGNQILDAAGNPVRFSGVNWNGFESGNYVVHGLWGGLGRTWVSYLDQMDSLGFNLIRLPFSGNVLDPGRMPQNIDYGTNPDLAGLTSLQVMDKIVQACGARGIRIILDYHRVEAGGTPEAGLWYTAAHPESTWIDNWKTLVTRYKDDPTVVGVDLFNEVHDGAGHPGPYWSADGTNEPYNWRTAAKRCADAIQAINPNLLICVQGLHAYNGESGWWGAVLLGVKDHPLVLTVANRLVYEVHDYGPNVWTQTWHNDPTFPANLPGHWDHQWGFVHTDGIAPIWVGEWGSTLDPAKEVQWATSLRDYIQAKGLSWTWWCWTPNSGDTGGILTDDWTSTHASKLSLTSAVMYPGFSSSSGGPPPPTPGQTPYGGTAAAIPGTLQAENFDEGGEGVGYHDSDAVNSGGQYRTTGVDIETSSDAGGGFNVGWLSPGEWLEYTMNVGTAGTYSIDFRVASGLTGGTFHLESGGVDLTGTLAAPGTGGWQTWVTVTATGVALPAGAQELRVIFDGGSFNFNSAAFTLTAAGPPAPPPGGGAPPAEGGGGGGDEGCGCTGLEFLALLALRRRSRSQAILAKGPNA